MDRSRRNKRIRKDVKIMRTRAAVSGGLTRMASTPIVATKKQEASDDAPTADASPERPKLPDLNLSRVENQATQPFSPCSPMLASPMGEPTHSQRRLSFSNQNSQMTLDYVTARLNSVTADNFVACSNRLCREIIRKRRFSCMSGVRCSLSDKFSEVISKDQKDQQTPPPTDQFPKQAKLDMEIDASAPTTPVRPRSTRTGNRKIRSPKKLNGLRSPLAFHVDRNMNKAYVMPNPGSGSPVFKLAFRNHDTPNSDVATVGSLLSPCHTPETSPKGDSDVSPSKEVRKRLSQLSMDYSSCYAPIKHCSGSQTVFQRDFNNSILNERHLIETDLSQLPFANMNDSELRYLHATSAAVLAANHAHEDSSCERLERSINHFTLSQQRSQRRHSSSSSCAPQAYGDGDSGTSGELGRPSGPITNEFPGMMSSDICNFPSYRFCMEFFVHERLEDSRFGLIFATRNRLDGLLYCIKKSRGAGDRLLDGLGNIHDSRAGPSFAEARLELLQEARALSALQVHENVVRYFSTWMEYDCVYIQLEFCNGGSLKDFLLTENNRRSLPHFRTLQVLGDIGSALSYVHQRGMLHLDLTPGNVLITSPLICDEAGDYVDIKQILDRRATMLEPLLANLEAHVVFKLADFGRCRTQSHPKLLEDVGDAEYMPPEVFGRMDGEPDADLDMEKIDVFSLGLTSYYCMGGERIEKPESEEDRICYNRLLNNPPQADWKLFRFVQSMVSIPPQRPTVSDILDFPGVCEASASRECLERRLKKLQR